MTADTHVTATFTLNTYSLTTATTGNGAGTVSNTPSGSTFDYGTVVTLTATPAVSSSFGGPDANVLEYLRGGRSTRLILIIILQDFTLS